MLKSQSASHTTSKACPWPRKNVVTAASVLMIFFELVARTPMVTELIWRAERGASVCHRYCN